MNRYALAIAFTALAAAGPSFADDITIETDTFVSVASRAQVQQELAQFKASGVDPWAQDYNPLVAFRGTNRRADAAAQYIRSRDAVAAFGSEDSGSAFLAGEPAQERRASIAAGQPHVAL